MSKPSPVWPTVNGVHVVSTGVEGEKPGETPTRRNCLHTDALITQPLHGIDTVCDIIDYSARTHGTKPALGWRDIVNVTEEEKEVTKNVGGKEVVEKKKWRYFQLSPYKYLNYVEVKEHVERIAAGLAELGIAKDEVFNIYSQTCVNWQLISHACMAISTVVATAYETLGEPGLTHSLNEPDCVGIFTNAELLPSVARVLPNTPTVRVVIYDGDANSGDLERIKSAREDIRVLHINDVLELGKGKSVDPSRRPNPDVVACIMYTSGTTGAPKGVIITHSNLIASLGAIWHLLGHHLRPTDTFLAYLPLAHILEYIVELAFYFVGMATGYGRVKTLTDASVRNCLGDLREFKPSIMIGVPAVWEMIRKGILVKVGASGPTKRFVFNSALAVKKANVPGLKQVMDSVVLSAVKQQTGGRLRLAMSGGSALSPETQEFLSLALVTILQGYGLTETCGMCAILPPEFMQIGSVGALVPSMETKLRDVPDAGYISTNPLPQGEILLRGSSLFKGYYKRDDLNNDKAIFTDDGWFCTGDIGQWNPDGTLSIIDRIKNLIKLQSGEYIALERLESIYKSCHLVANICVYATPHAQQPIAIVIPHEAHLRQALSGSKADMSLHGLCEDKEVKDKILKACNDMGKKSSFKPMELLQSVILTAEEWTPENGLVTAAQKLQRRKVAEKFRAEIDEVYKQQD